MTRRQPPPQTRSSRLRPYTQNRSAVTEECAPWLHPWTEKLLDWCTLENGSNVVVITSALHAVGRRFEPGIQYDSLFFCFENVESPQASPTNFYAREPRGRREACKTVRHCCEF